MKKSCNNRNFNQTNIKNERIQMTEKEKLVLISRTILAHMCGMNVYACFCLGFTLIKSISFDVVFLILAILMYRTAMRKVQKTMPVFVVAFLFAFAFLLGVVVMAWIGFLWNKNGIVIVMNAEIPVALFMRFAEYRWNNR